MTTRRTFLATLPAVTLAVTIAQRASAQAAKLEESESMAVSLGYKHDAAKVDAKKFTAYATGRNCANCQLYQGKTTDDWAACPPVGGKLVNAKGWCAAWAKKA